MSRSRPFVIALDGPAAAGKSSVGLGVARQLGLGYFDTGLLYRALTRLALARATDIASGPALAALIPELDIQIDPRGHVFRDGDDITDELRDVAVNSSVSAVSAHPQVREGMRPVQRQLIVAPGLVMAGRDIGTIIVPEAQLKIWLNASPEERARRRAAQTGERFEVVLEGMRQRDQLDASRDVAPMARAADAVTVDTDALSLEQVIATIVQLATERRV